MKKLSLLLLIFLSACQAVNSSVEQAPPAPAITPEGKAEITAEPVIIEPPKPRFIIDTIMDLAPDTLKNILGVPSLKRKEKDAEVWLYTNRECILHLYFYPNENGDYRLSYVDTQAVGLSVDNPTVSPNACLDSHVRAYNPEPEIKPDPEPSSQDNDINQQQDILGN